LNALSMMDSSIMVQHSFVVPPKIPWWTLAGDASATEEFIRLTPDRQSKMGSMWSTEPGKLEDWEAIFRFKVHGQGELGADGLAFWYTQTKGSVGDFFGAQEHFVGLGIIIDTYDNDGTGKHPYLAVLVNDGTQSFEHDHSHNPGASTRSNTVEIGGCQVRTRNRGNPSAVKVVFNQGNVEVFIDEEGGVNWRKCVSENYVDEIRLGSYFGFSAATGDLADAHDIYSLEVHSLNNNFFPKISEENRLQYYLASELSRLQYQVKHLTAEFGVESGPLQHRGSAGTASGAQSIENQISDLKKAVSGVMDLLLNSRQDNSALQGIKDYTQDFQNLNNAIIKNSVTFRDQYTSQQAMVNELRSELRKIRNENNNTNSSGGSWGEEIVILILLLIIAFLGYRLVAVSKDRSKKFF